MHFVADETLLELSRKLHRAYTCGAKEVVCALTHDYRKLTMTPMVSQLANVVVPQPIHCGKSNHYHGRVQDARIG